MDTIWDQARAAISLIANGDAHSALTIYDALHRGEQAERKLALIRAELASVRRARAEYDASVAAGED